MAKSKIMAKVKYDFSTNKGRNKCYTSFSSKFDWKIHFYYPSSSSTSKAQSKGQVIKNMIFTK